jgi:hypothetical protein
MIKKSFTIICAALVVTAALILTGCEHNVSSGDGDGDDGGQRATVASVTVNPATVSVARGKTQAFTATVSGTNSPAQTVTWSVNGGGAGTAISADGVLSVAAGESAINLTVTAVSTVDAAKSGTAVITVTAASGDSETGTGGSGETGSGGTGETGGSGGGGSGSGETGNGETATVTGVTVSPDTASVTKGETKAFAATVSGTNSPAQTVTWSVSGHGAGTAISADGILSVAANETASTLTVKATSTVDATKSGTATVSVSDVQAPDGISITVGFNYGEITITGSNGGNVISKNGAPTSLTLNATGYTGVVWYVDGSPMDIQESENTITINASEHRAGSHSVTFTGKRDGVPYSRVLPFTVTE